MMIWLFLLIAQAPFSADLVMMLFKHHLKSTRSMADRGSTSSTSVQISLALRYEALENFWSPVQKQMI